jgi:ribosomal protein S24E
MRRLRQNIAQLITSQINFVYIHNINTEFFDTLNIQYNTTSILAYTYFVLLKNL